jgi:predicted flap endonuclease-1-like 5' DNA nuclease
MAWSQQFPGGAVVEERAERALRLPMGAVSPLWAVFGAAASAGVAYWWMTRWTRAVNVEALAFAAKPLPKAPPIEIVAEPDPVVEAVVEAASALETPPTPETTVEPGPVAAEPEPVVAAAETFADDLTLMTGIGPKLAAALSERGVTRFAQIAAWTAGDLAEVDAALSLKGRAVREAWVAQARRLAHH